MLNILCLHGCGQTSEIFKSVINGFITIGKKDFNFFFLEGEYPTENNGKRWYEQNLRLDQIGIIEYSDYFMKPLFRLHNFIILNKIDVLFGFSQGGNVIDTYINNFKDIYPIKYAVIFSGYNFVQDRVQIQNIPLLNVFSEEDEVVKPIYRPMNYRIINEMIHDKGHKMPTSKPFIREILKKISDHCKNG